MKIAPNLLPVAVIQAQISSDKAQNLENLIAQIVQACKQGAKLVILPELHNGPYFCQAQDVRHFDWAESIPGPTTEILTKLAQEYQAVIVGSIFERRLPGVYHNTAVILDVDGSLNIYRKMHIPDDPGFNEKFYFTPGDLGFNPIQTSVGKLGVLVCWDQWYPEAARIMALKGAEILIYPTAIGWHPNDSQEEKNRQLNAWQTIQVSHAVANNIPVISCNRVGFEPPFEASQPKVTGIEFWGNSFVCDAQGAMLALANKTSPELLFTTIDLNQSETIRRYWPYFRDRRVDAYQDILKRIAD